MARSFRYHFPKSRSKNLPKAIEAAKGLTGFQELEDGYEVRPTPAEIQGIPFGELLGYSEKWKGAAFYLDGEEVSKSDFSEAAISEEPSKEEPTESKDSSEEPPVAKPITPPEPVPEPAEAPPEPAESSTPAPSTPAKPVPKEELKPAPVPKSDPEQASEPEEPEPKRDQPEQEKATESKPEPKESPAETKPAAKGHEDVKKIPSPGGCCCLFPASAAGVTLLLFQFLFG